MIDIETVTVRDRIEDQVGEKARDQVLDYVKDQLCWAIEDQTWRRFVWRIKDQLNEKH